MQSITNRLVGICLAGGLLFAASCKRNDDNNGITPRGAAPSWGPSIRSEMLAVVEELDSFYQPPLELLSPQVARTQKTIFDAASRLALRNGISGPVYTVDATDQNINVNGTTLSIRVYRPNKGTGTYPGIVYFPGGGWVVSNKNTYDASSRAIAEQTGAVVVSVDYRKGPENKFPTAHKDAFAAYRWVLSNAASLNINPARVAVVGESAGANLACNVSIMARDSGITMPKHQVLIYPITQANMNTASYNQYAAAKPLNKALMTWFFGHYLNTMSQAADPRISLVNANLSGLPETTIINAEIDPLKDDGMLLEAKLKDYAVPVARRIYDGVTHEFFGINILLPEAREAQGYASSTLRAALQ